MPFFTTSDGTDIHYSDWGTGQPIVFSHGWPLSSDAWSLERKTLADAGYRVIAHDRRGHGKSAQPWQSNDMDTYARDLAELVEHLDLRDAVFVGHSTGGGDDQIVPIGNAALKSIELVKDGTLKVYPGAPHGIFGAYQQELIQDILDFIKK